MDSTAQEDNSEQVEGEKRTLKDFQNYCAYGSVDVNFYNTTLDDVVGYDTTKTIMKESIALPLLFPALFKRPIEAVLMYGPPGCGKTWILRAMAAATKCPLITVHCYSLLARNMESQATFIKAVFQCARDNLPCILLFEDIEVINDSQCKEAISEFYNQIFSETSQRVPLVASSVKPWSIDLFTRRQFPKKVYVGMPEEKDRQLIILSTLKDYNMMEEEITQLASQTEGFSVSDLIVFMRDAMMEPIRKIQKSSHFKKSKGPLPSDPDTIVDDLFSICDADDPDAQQLNFMDIPQEKIVVPLLQMTDVILALQKSRPTVTKEELHQYEEFKSIYEP